MPYFSLIEKPAVSSSDEMGDDSYPDLDTCPKEPVQAPDAPAQDTQDEVGAQPPAAPTRAPVLNPPDWQELLFGGREKSCDPILKKFNPTYYEDCKLAEDAALNHLAKYDIPVFNCLRDVNQHQVTRALKLLRKGESGKKKLTSVEEVLAYTLLLDFLSCCCQEGNLLNLYEKCKDERKRCHIDSIDTDLGSAIEYLKGCTLKQIQSADRLVKASMHRISSSLSISAQSTKFSFKRKISALEREENNMKGNPVYHFSDEDLCSPSKKKLKPTFDVMATTNKWKKQPLQARNPDRLPFSPRKDKTLGFISKPQSEELQCTPSKPCREDDTRLPFGPSCSQSTSTPKSSKSSYFLKELFVSDDDELPNPKQPSQVSRQLLTSKESVSSKERTHFLSPTLSEQKVLKIKPDMNSVSGFVDISSLPQSNGYSSDDSLPDIPIDLKSYVSKKKSMTPKKSSPLKAKMPLPCSPSSSAVDSQKTSISIEQQVIASRPFKTFSPVKPKSPYKNKFTTWNSSKYESLGKSPVRSTSVSALRSPLKAAALSVTALSKEQNGNVLNTQVLKSPLKEVKSHRFQQNDNRLLKSSKLQHLSKPNGVPRVYWFQFRKCLCGKCKHGEILAVRLALPVQFNTEEVQEKIISMVRSSKKVKCRCGNCVPELLNEENTYGINI